MWGQLGTLASIIFASAFVAASAIAEVIETSLHCDGSVVHFNRDETNELWLGGVSVQLKNNNVMVGNSIFFDGDYFATAYDAGEPAIHFSKAVSNNRKILGTINRLNGELSLSDVDVLDIKLFKSFYGECKVARRLF